MLNNKNESDFEKIWQEFEEDVRKYCQQCFGASSVRVDYCVEFIKKDFIKACKAGIDINSPKWFLYFLMNKDAKEFKKSNQIIKPAPKKFTFSPFEIPPIVFDELESVRIATVSQKHIPRKLPYEDILNRFVPESDPENKYLGSRVKKIIESPHWTIIKSLLPVQMKIRFSEFEKCNYSVSKLAQKQNSTIPTTQNQITAIRRVIFLLYCINFIPEVQRDYYTLTDSFTVDVINHVIYKNREYYQKKFSNEKWLVLIGLIEATINESILSVDDYCTILKIDKNDDNKLSYIRNINRSLNYIIGSEIIENIRGKGYRLNTMPTHQNSLFE